MHRNIGSSQQVVQADVSGGETHLLQQSPLNQGQQLAAAIQVEGQAVCVHTVHLQLRLVCRYQSCLQYATIMAGTAALTKANTYLTMSRTVEREY